jgi:hypothetical protein
MRNIISTIFKTAIGIALLFGMTNVAVAQLPDPGMTITPGNTALVITDPQNDFLSPKGVTWGVVGESVTENNTVANIESLFKAAKQNGVPVFISPHYYYPTDKGWQFEGALETSKDLRIPGLTGFLATSLISTTARPSSPARTRCMDRRTTIYCCSFASVASTR